MSEVEELTARVEMPLSLFKKLKDKDFFEQLELKTVYNPNIDYSMSKEWKEAKEKVKEAFLLKMGIEEQIRVELVLKQ